MLKLITGILFLSSLSRAQLFSDEPIYTVNHKRALHCVSDKFLSISIDPAVFLTGLNLSDTSLELAGHLSPAFIRIAGPSTRFVKYEDSDESPTGHLSEDSTNVIVTPSMWFGINEWLTMANLTPVFGINDFEWDPKSTMPLLEMSDKFNVSCHWQLGYDCSNKSVEEYKKDLKSFKAILEKFPGKSEVWGVVGSDLRQCISSDHPESTRKVLDDLGKTISAVVAEPQNREDQIDQVYSKLVSSPMGLRTPVWLTAPKEDHYVSFLTALSWANQIGIAAKTGYEVIFRQPRLYEFFSETPAYWVSVMHKALMGRTVLDVKPNPSGSNPQISIYAHCTRHQNAFTRSGAMTIMMVNNGTTNHTNLVRFGTVLLKNTEVQSYILTSSDEDSTNVFLNDEKLSLKLFAGDKINVLPKLRRARIMNYLSLSLPPKSIGYFVLPAAQIPACLNEESDLKSVLAEITEDQNIDFSEEKSVDLKPRLGWKMTPSLRDLQHIMEKELESDERYYKGMKIRKSIPKKNSPEALHTTRENRNFFIDRVRMAERQKKHDDASRRVDKEKEEDAHKELELELSSAEIRGILSDRARVKAAKKNIVFTSEELDEIMDKATQRILKNKHTSITIRRKDKREAREKKDINTRLLNAKTQSDERRKSLVKELDRLGYKKRDKRDINMELLKTKGGINEQNRKLDTNMRGNFENNEEKEATIRRDDETSLELFKDYEDAKGTKKSELPDKDVYAEMANSDEMFALTTEKPKRTAFKPKPKHGLYALPKLPVLKPKPVILPPLKPVERKAAVEEFQYNPSSSLSLEDDMADFDINEDDLEIIPDNFDCIHEFVPMPKMQPRIQVDEEPIELWESEVPREEKGNTPDIARRGFAVTDEQLVKDFKIDSFEDGSLENDYAYFDSNEKSILRLRRSTPNVQKSINNNLDEDISERYTSLTKDLKDWKPSDILTLDNQIRSPHLKDSQEVRNENIKLLKRGIINSKEINSMENEIDGFLSEIAKGAEIIPKLDSDNGDYQLIFPNQDKVEVVENQGNTELKMVFHGKNYAETLIKDIENKTLHNAMQVTSEDSNIQKIVKKPAGVWYKLVGSFADFFKGLGKKIKKYVFDDLLK